MRDDLFHVIMCHSDPIALATLKRHLPYWQQLGGPILFFSPVDKAVRIDGHQALVYGKACHNGPASIDRLRFLLNHMADRAIGFSKLVVWEYDALAISPCFPETRDDAVTCNAFTNHQPEIFHSRVYTHPPIVIPMALMPKIVEAMAGVPNDAERSFWDRWLPVVIERAGIPIVSFVEDLGTGYSQNTIEPAHLPSAIDAATLGTRVWHGVKSAETLKAITSVSPWILHSTGHDTKYISFSLYGDPNSLKYFVGMRRNLELAKQFYADWRVRIYMPEEMCGSAWHSEFRDYVKFGPPDIHPMMWRYLVLDSPDCEMAIIRDADSRISAREVAAVDEWITSGRLAHSCADHGAHARRFNGGMCGFRRGAIHGWERLIRSYLKNHAGAYGGTDQDQQFLCTLAWEQVKNSVLRHDSHTAKAYPGSMPFPTKREGWRFMGEVWEVAEDGTETPRALDWPMLQDVGEEARKEAILDAVFTPII